MMSKEKELAHEIERCLNEAGKAISASINGNGWVDGTRISIESVKVYVDVIEVNDHTSLDESIIETHKTEYTVKNKETISKTFSKYVVSYFDLKDRKVLMTISITLSVLDRTIDADVYVKFTYRIFQDIVNKSFIRKHDGSVVKIPDETDNSVQRGEPEVTTYITTETVRRTTF